MTSICTKKQTVLKLIWFSFRRLHERISIITTEFDLLQVVGVWPGLVGGLVGRVVEGVGEEMSRLMACVSQWSRWGGVQAQVDLAALTTVLHSHISPAARLVMHYLPYSSLISS